MNYSMASKTSLSDKLKLLHFVMKCCKVNYIHCIDATDVYSFQCHSSTKYSIPYVIKYVLSIVYRLRHGVKWLNFWFPIQLIMLPCALSILAYWENGSWFYLQIMCWLFWKNQKIDSIRTLKWDWLDTQRILKKEMWTTICWHGDTCNKMWTQFDAPIVT